MANPNQSPFSNPQNSVEDPIRRSTGGAWLAAEPGSGGPKAFEEERDYGWKIKPDVRAEHVAVMAFGSAGAKEDVKMGYLQEPVKDRKGRPKYKYDKNGNPIAITKDKLDKHGQRIPTYELKSDGKGGFDLDVVGLSQNLENGMRWRYKTTADGVFAINPRNNIKPGGKDYQPRRVEGWIDGKPQAAAAKVGGFVLDSVKHLFGQKTHHAHHRHYATSTGLEGYDKELGLEHLHANYDAHHDPKNGLKLFDVDNLENLNERIDAEIVAEARRLNRKLTSQEARAIRGVLIYDYVERGKNPDYPNTGALREMVSVQARIERRRREDIKNAEAIQAARAQAMRDAKEAADLQRDAHEATIRMDERSKDEALNVESRHQELLDNLYDNNTDLFNELRDRNQDLLDKLGHNHAELMSMLEDKILAELTLVKGAVKDIPDLKAAFDQYVTDWQTEKGNATGDATRERQRRIQVDTQMLTRLDELKAKLHDAQRDTNTHATAQTAATQAHAQAAADQATAAAAQAFAMRDQATAAADQAKTLQDIADELKKRPAASPTTSASTSTGPTGPSAPSTPFSKPSGPHRTPNMDDIVDAEVVDEDREAGVPPRAIGSTPHTPETSGDQSDPDQ